MNNYTLSKTFSFKEEANGFVDLLKRQNIDYKVEKIDQNMIPYLAASAPEGYGLFILNDHISKLEEVIGQSIGEENLAEHPLQVMSDEELIDILKKQDEWSIEDILVTRRLLEERKIEISETEIKAFNEERLIELQKQKSGGSLTKILAVLFPVIGLAGLGILGIIGTVIYVFSYGMAFNYLFDYRKLPNGQKVKTYNSKTRAFGLFVLIWTIAITAGTIYYVQYYM